MNAAEIMRPSPLTIEASETVQEALGMMDDFGIDELPVMEGDHFIGVVTSAAIHGLSERLGPFEQIPECRIVEITSYGTTCGPHDDGLTVLDHMEQDDAQHSYVVADDGALLGAIDLETLIELLPSDVSAGYIERQNYRTLIH